MKVTAVVHQIRRLHSNLDNSQSHAPTATALAMLLLCGSVVQAVPTPFTMLYNYPNSSAEVLDPNPLTPGSRGRATVIGMEGDLVDGAYVGGGAGNTYASCSSDLLHSRGASGRVYMNWNSVLSLDGGDNVDLYLDWQMNMFADDSAFGFYALAKAYTKAEIRFYDSSYEDIYNNVFVWTDTMFMTETLYLGKAPDFSESNECVAARIRVEIVSTATTVSAGYAIATNTTTLNFKLWADDPDLPGPDVVPEPASLCLSVLGLGCLGMIRRTRHAKVR